MQYVLASHDLGEVPGEPFFAGVDALLAEANGGIARLLVPLHPAIDSSPLPADQKHLLKTKPVDWYLQVFGTFENVATEIVNEANRLSGRSKRTIGIPMVNQMQVDMATEDPRDATLASPAHRRAVHVLRVGNNFIILLLQDPGALAAATKNIFVKYAIPFGDQVASYVRSAGEQAKRTAEAAWKAGAATVANIASGAAQAGQNAAAAVQANAGAVTSTVANVVNQAASTVTSTVSNVVNQGANAITSAFGLRGLGQGWEEGAAGGGAAGGATAGVGGGTATGVATTPEIAILIAKILLSAGKGAAKGAVNVVTQGAGGKTPQTGSEGASGGISETLFGPGGWEKAPTSTKVAVVAAAGLTTFAVVTLVRRRKSR